MRSPAKAARVSATERFHRAAAKRGPAPAVLLAAGLGACFLVVAGLILLAPHESSRDAFDATVALEEAGVAKLEHQGLWLDAAGRLDGLLTRVAGVERWNSRAAEWRTRAKIDRALAVERKRADDAFDAFRARAQKAGKEEIRVCWEEGQELKRRVGAAAVPWKAEVEILLAELEKKMAPPSEPWQAQRELIRRECRLDVRSEADWAKALRLWAAYLAGSVGAADRSGAESELRSMQARAREDFAVVRLKAARLEDPRAELAKHRARFKGSAVEAELEALLR